MRPASIAAARGALLLLLLLLQAKPGVSFSGTVGQAVAAGAKAGCQGTHNYGKQKENGLPTGSHSQMSCVQAFWMRKGAQSKARAVAMCWP